MPILRFMDLLAQYLFERRDIAALDRRPPVNASRRRSTVSPDQYWLSYA